MAVGELEEPEIMGLRRNQKDAFRAFWADNFGRKCFWCGGRFRAWPKSATFDHFFPLARARFDHTNNMVLAHERCNRERAAALPTEEDMRRFLALRGKDAMDTFRAYEARLTLMVAGWRPETAALMAPKVGEWFPVWKMPGSPAVMPDKDAGKFIADEVK